MSNMAKKFKFSIIHTILHFIILIIPRFFGLLALSCNIWQHSLKKSTFWYSYAIIFAIFFTIFYPISILSIFFNSNLPSYGIIAYLDKIYHISIYIFSLYTFFYYISFSDTLIYHHNSGFQCYKRCIQLNHDKHINENKLLFPFIFRIIYSYIGYFTLNYTKHLQDSASTASIPLFYKLIECLPDLLMECIMIRLQYVIVMQIICLKYLNRAFLNCIDELNAVPRRKPAKLNIVCCCLNDRFNEIVKNYIFVYNKCRATEKYASNLVVFSILKTSFHLTIRVSKGLWKKVVKEFYFQRKLFFYSYCLFSTIFMIRYMAKLIYFKFISLVLDVFFIFWI